MTFKTADLCDENEQKVQTVAPRFKNYGAINRFNGAIVTIRALGDFSRVREQLNLAGDGKVLVVDNDASMNCAMLGDLLAAAGVKNGWQGVVINGCIRDSAEIADMDIGVKALATNPRKGARNDQGELDVTLEFGGVSFNPGDFLYSDEDGIIVSPEALI
jgi:regulator of ribonuclease activity A